MQVGLSEETLSRRTFQHNLGLWRRPLVSPVCRLPSGVPSESGRWANGVVDGPSHKRLLVPCGSCYCLRPYALMTLLSNLAKQSSFLFSHLKKRDSQPGESIQEDSPMFLSTPAYRGSVVRIKPVLLAVSPADISCCLFPPSTRLAFNAGHLRLLVQGSRQSGESYKADCHE